VLLTGTTGGRRGVDGVDDLGAVDALEVDRGDADFAAATALPSADEDCAAAGLEVRLGRRERFGMRNPARQSTTISPRIRTPCDAVPACRMTATIDDDRRHRATPGT
jgi:hypothetical protein